MSDGRTTSGGGRVVVWSHDPTLAAAGDNGQTAGLQFISVGSAFETTAELLAAPAVALVIDLRLLSPRHLRLVQIARDLRLEMLAVGSLPAAMTAEDLSGIRLVSRVDLPTLLRTAAQSPPRAAATPTAQQSDAAEAPRAVRLAPAGKKPPEPADDPTFDTVTAADEPAKAPEPAEPAPRSGPAAEGISERGGAAETGPSQPSTGQVDRAGGDSPDDEGLLTPEEIAALLGNEL